MIEIRDMWRVTNPQPRNDKSGAVVGVFDAVVGELVVTGCQVVRRQDGELIVCMPSFVRRGRDKERSVRFLDRARLLQFRQMAIRAFNDAPAENMADGLRRMLGAAERESLTAAGL